MPTQDTRYRCAYCGNSYTHPPGPMPVRLPNTTAVKVCLPCWHDRRGPDWFLTEHGNPVRLKDTQIKQLKAEGSTTAIFNGRYERVHLSQFIKEAH